MTPLRTAGGEVAVGERLARDLPWVLAAGVLVVTVRTVLDSRFGWDAHAYWTAMRGEVYTGGPTTEDAFLYSPAFVHVVRPLGALPWPVFAGLWSAAAGLVFAVLLRPLGWRRALPLWLCCSLEIVSGNVFWLFAAVAAVGARFPAAWVVPALTKITPAVGPVWFAARKDWRGLAVALGALGVVASASWLADPQLWREWLDFLGAYAGSTTGRVGLPSPPPLVRVPLALLLVAWGSRTDRRWTLPAGMVLATPVFGLAALTVLAALPHLERARLRGPAAG